MSDFLRCDVCNYQLVCTGQDPASDWFHYHCTNSECKKEFRFPPWIWDGIIDDDQEDDYEDDCVPCGCRFCWCPNCSIAGETCSDCLSGVHQG